MKRYHHRLPEKKTASKESVLYYAAHYRGPRIVECDLDWMPTLTPEPTEHPPGSEGKIEVLAQRVLAGEDLWHPEDNGMAEWKRQKTGRPSHLVDLLGLPCPQGAAELFSGHRVIRSSRGMSEEMWG